MQPGYPSTHPPYLLQHAIRQIHVCVCVMSSICHTETVRFKYTAQESTMAYAIPRLKGLISINKRVAAG